MERRLVHYEVLTNQILGITVGWLVVYFLYPILIPLGPGSMATISSIVFFIISYIRLYLVRIYFKKIEREERWKKLKRD
jgi:membrane protein implicated in regulation of membrane protease activity